MSVRATVGGADFVEIRHSCMLALLSKFLLQSPPPRRHPVFGDVHPQTASGGSGLIFQLGENVHAWMLKASVGVAVTRLDQHGVEVFARLFDVDVREHSAVLVPSSTRRELQAQTPA